MELRKVNGINTVPKIDEVCRICETMEHPTNDCPTIPAFKEVLHDQANAMNMVKNHTCPPIQRHTIQGGGITQILVGRMII